MTIDPIFLFDNIAFKISYVAITIFLFFLILIPSNRIKKIIAIVLCISLIISLLNPSIVRQIIFYKEGSKYYYRSIFDHLAFYFCVFIGINIIVDILKNKETKSIIYILGFPFILYAFINPNMLYCTEVTEKALNNVSMVGYCIFMPTLFVIYLDRIRLVFQIDNERISFIGIFEFLFMIMICFPVELANRTNLVYHDGLYVPFKGRYLDSINSRLFDYIYWLTIIYLLITAFLYLFYIKKFCKDKKTFILKSVICLGIQDFISRADFFYDNHFGAKIIIDSACGFLIVSVLIYLLFNKKSFAYFSGFVLAPIAVMYIVLNRFSDIIYNFFYYRNLNSIYYHIMMVPIGFSILFIEKKANLKSILKSIYIGPFAIVIYSIFVNIIGLLEIILKIDLNYEYLNGFMYFQCLVPGLTDFAMSIEITYNKLVFYPINFVLNILLFCLLEIIMFFIIREFGVITSKIKKTKQKKNL